MGKPAVGTETTSAAGWTVAELSRLIEGGELSPREVADHYLSRIERIDGDMAAFSSVRPERVMEEAAAAEREIAAGRRRGPLHGIPVAVKDLIFVAGLPMTGGSLLYEHHVAGEDDAVVARLRDAGAVILGKTNTAEFGFSANQTANRVAGETRNPWNRERSPGGSSGGSAAAVAAGLAPVAVGSDGGGSIRIPSSFCGLAGIKPTFGRVPMYPGCRHPGWPGLSGWESVEHVGPIARTTLDVGLMLDVMCGPDSRDRHSLPAPGASLAADLVGAGAGDLTGLRVAWTADWGGSQPVAPDVRRRVAATAAALEGRGAAVEEISPPPVDALQAFGLTVALDADPPALMAAIDGRADLVNPRLIQIVTEEWSFGDVVSALRTRRELFLAVAGMLAQFDVLVTPTVPVTALKLGEQGPDAIDGRPVAEPDRPRAIIEFTYPFNLTGHPAMSVPCGSGDDGLPVGLQVVGDRLREDVVLRVARAVEDIHPPALAPDVG